MFPTWVDFYSLKALERFFRLSPLKRYSDAEHPTIHCSSGPYRSGQRKLSFPIAQSPECILQKPAVVLREKTFMRPESCSRTKESYPMRAESPGRSRFFIFCHPIGCKTVEMLQNTGHRVHVEKPYHNAAYPPGV